MSEYTLDTDAIRAASSRSIGGDWFDAWLAQHDRKVAAKALRDVATAFIDWDVIYGHEPSTPAIEESHRTSAWLEDQADRIENGEAL